MSTLQQKKDFATPAKDESQNAFLLAKEALAFIGTFRTPPTPEVYEVWYRYAEGQNKAIQEQLSHAVNVAKAVSVEQLHELRQQFLMDSDESQANIEISQKLAMEMDGLQSLISSQQDAGVEFGGSISLANARLHSENATSAEIKSCLNSVLQSNEKMQQQISEMDSKLGSSRSQIDGLKENLAELRKTILVDPLTGIGNRRSFDTTISQTNELRKTNSNLYLFLVDLDEFKDVNDTYGHATGDRLLRFVANSLKKLTASGTHARYGGDEFAVFVNVDGPAEAKQLADDICNFFFQSNFVASTTGESLKKITISLGAAVLRAEDDADSWFERADKLLYRAKAGGRNRAMVERSYGD